MDLDDFILLVLYSPLTALLPIGRYSNQYIYILPYFVGDRAVN